MADLSLYKVDLDTPQPDGPNGEKRRGESPRTAFTKYNDALDEIGGVFVEKEEGKGLSTNDYDDAAKEKVDAMGSAASRNVMTSLTDDETPNALMPREAFGLGRAEGHPFTSFSTPNRIGWYFASNVQNIAGMPDGISGSYVVILDRENHYTLKQNVIALGGRIFHGVATGPTTAPAIWREVYHTGNAVAPGGLMQFGATPNGRFWRYGSNMQITQAQITIDFTNYLSLLSGGVFSVQIPSVAPFQVNSNPSGYISMVQTGYSINPNRFLSKTQLNVDHTNGSAVLYRVDNSDMANEAVQRSFVITLIGRHI
ncbi:hypothetical protein [Vibrio metschnikovii]|uniref:hypothetical protein n=1 Tax=Vibrio metschnikovii TaxID=28172 RepID=UPI001302DDDA|nr:hypothetical protein [Vibrio metschnikovii]